MTALPKKKYTLEEYLELDVDGMESEVKLESVNATLTLRELYERVNFQ